MDAGTQAGAERNLPLFRQRNFSALWWGQLISLLGERLTYLALIGLLSEHTRHFADPRSSLLLTILANVMLAPVLLFSPFTGAGVDRWNLRRVMVVSDALRAAMVALIPILYPFTHHTLPVYALVFGLFTCNVFFLPSKSAITPELVPPSQLLAANALLAAAGIAATALAALGGGWVVDHWGWPIALWINVFVQQRRIDNFLAQKFWRNVRTAREQETVHFFEWNLLVQPVPDFNFRMFTENCAKRFCVFASDPRGQIRHARICDFARDM